MQVEYRISVVIRRKGENYLWGKEYKLEDFDDIEHLLSINDIKVVQVVEDDIAESEEYEFRNTEE